MPTKSLFWTEMGYEVNTLESLLLKGSFHLHFHIKSLQGSKEKWGEGEKREKVHVGSGFQPYGQEHLQAEVMVSFQLFPSRILLPFCEFVLGTAQL